MAQRSLRQPVPAFVRRLYEGAALYQTDSRGALGPARRRMDEAALKVPDFIKRLLNRRTGLLLRIKAADDPASWRRPAEELLGVERELRSLGKSLDGTLVPRFGSQDAYVAMWYSRSAPPPYPIIRDATQWLGRALDPRVAETVEAKESVWVEVLKDGDGDGRPYMDQNGIHVYRSTPSHVYAHEYGHLVEDALPRVLAGARELRNDQRNGKLATISQMMGEWRPDEKVDLGPADPYWGRVPNEETGGHTEMTAGGFGAMMWGPGTLYVSDPLHYGFIAAVMAGDYL